jgi:metal-responsive CopG/Arc/MetJ family transcriptional regulator
MGRDLRKRVNLSVRVPEDVVERIDGIVRAQGRRLGVTFSRGAILRRMLEMGIEQYAAHLVVAELQDEHPKLRKTE